MAHIADKTPLDRASVDARTLLQKSGLCRASERGDAALDGAIRYRLVWDMKLIFLHGAPATGKLTVAKALLRLVSGRLFDNHAAIDFARTIFDFGVPGFWQLVHDARLCALETASQHGVPLVVTTFCYSDPEDRPQFEQFEAIMERHGGELLPAFLHCSEDEIIRRVGNPDRVERRKVTSVEGLNRFRTNYNDAPIPRTNCIMLDTATRPADLTALEIVRRFELNALPGS